jgi:cytidylate kinase
MGSRVITVTREFGSLGRPIAIRLAEKLGIEYFDRDIIEKAAADMGKPVAVLDEIDEHLITGYRKMRHPLGVGSAASQDKLFEIEREIILELSAREDCVVIGRCSDCVLTEAGRKDLLRVFIYAPYQDRFQICLKDFGFTVEAAEEYIRDVDKERIAYYKRYTQERFDSPKYRDLLVNSAALGFDKTVDMLYQATVLKFGADIVRPAK